MHIGRTKTQMGGNHADRLAHHRADWLVHVALVVEQANQVALGQDAHRTLLFNHHDVTDQMLTHPLDHAGQAAVRGYREHVGFHDVCQMQVGNRNHRKLLAPISHFALLLNFVVMLLL